jgi:hypothetical protein
VDGDEGMGSEGESKAEIFGAGLYPMCDMRTIAGRLPEVQAVPDLF